ncbi:hypothetical protein O1M63_07010 [Streptomyces mirabilis]|nr:hypothetical protein [Streptomyces mirabilis]
MLAALGARHEGLRTVFADAPHGPVRRVLAACAPPLVTLEAAGAGGAGTRWRRCTGIWPRGRQLVAGRAGCRSSSPWAVWPGARICCRSCTTTRWPTAGRRRCCGRNCSPTTTVPRTGARWYGVASRAGYGGRAAVAARPGGLRAAGERAERLRGFPAAVDLAEGAPRPAVFDVRGERLHVGLDVRLRDAADATARRAGVPHATVLLAAWALAVGRRAGLERLLVGCEVPRRATAALLGTPRRARRRYRWAANWRAASTTSCAGRLRVQRGPRLRGPRHRRAGARARVRPDRSRPVLTPVTFAARDELLPAHVRAGALSARFHHGHAGAVTADAALTVLRWREDPLLRLEFAPRCSPARGPCGWPASCAARWPR